MDCRPTWSRILGMVAAAVLVGAPARAAESGAYGFAVIVTLSPKAAARLALLNERITAAAVYFGEPTPAAQRRADEMGQIALGDERVTIAGSGGTARFTGASVARSRLAWVKGRVPQVNVNVFSARLHDPNNILACDLYEGDVAAVAQHPKTLNCRLIGD